MKPAISVPITYVNTPGELSGCVTVLAQASSIAIDLEFDSNNHRYGVTPSLIQLATSEHCFVVDLLAGLDPQPLFALLEDEAIEKLMHAPGEDLRLLHRIGCFPQNLFDTEVVARLLNYERTGQAAMLVEKLGIVLEKGQQRSNWLLRPLSGAQINYAAADVLWLQQLKEQLVAEAAERGLMGFVQEEQARLSLTRYVPEAIGNFLKPGDRVNFSPWQQHLLNGLLRYRDDLARNINRPTYQVMPEEIVRDLATGRCTVTEAFSRPGIHPRFRNATIAASLAGQLQSLWAEADALQLSKRRPQRPRLSQKAVHDRDHLFAPIQEALRQQFGLYAAKLLLSDRLVGDLLTGTTTLADLPAYRQALFAQAARDLGIELGDYAVKESGG